MTIIGVGPFGGDAEVQKANRRCAGDPSLRLKNGFAQDDAAILEDAILSLHVTSSQIALGF
jgi:hypothetical protein